jgi:hypothetical protein
MGAGAIRASRWGWLSRKLKRTLPPAWGLDRAGVSLTTNAAGLVAILPIASIVRPATHKELEELREAGCFDGKTLAPGCFIHALFHIDRVTTTLDGRLVLLEAGPQWTEEDRRKAWRARASRGRAAMR